MFKKSKNSDVYIVGGGPSLSDVDLGTLFDKDTICANKSIFLVPNPNYFITVDYTFLRKINIQEFKNLIVPKFFVANFAVKSLCEVDGAIVDTRESFKRKNGIGLIYNLNPFDVIIKSRRNNEIGLTFDDFRTGDNSGFCAFQLGVLLGYKRIHLIGIDLNPDDENTHGHDGYGESHEKFYSKTEHYYNMFVSGIKMVLDEKPDIKIISHSKDSKLNNIIPYVPISRNKKI